MSFWAVVETEAQHEHTARLLIMRLGYETYLPRIKHRKPDHAAVPEISVRAHHRPLVSGAMDAACAANSDAR